MPSREIPRISMPGREEFLHDCVFERTPVVITDLFGGQEIATIQTAEDAVRAWGTARIHVQEEYASGEGAAAPAQPTFMTFAEYVDFIRSNPSTRLCCTEYDTPARVLASFRLPDVCRVGGSVDDEIFGLPKKYGDFDLMTAVFIANAGNVGHLHFDGDQREVLLHQVYGRKRVVLFQPEAAIHLRTLDGPYSRPSLSGLYLEHVSLEEKLSLVDAAGGYHTILAPGETIYIPRLMWHHLEYIDDAMSFNIRFGRSRIGRFLSLDHFHRDPYIQNVAARMTGSDDALRAFDPIVDDIKAEYVRRVPDARQKIRDVRSLFRRLCAEVSPDACPDQLCPPEREAEQVTRIAESRDMKGALKYADPALIKGTRPSGPMAARQRDIVEEGMARCGYAEGTRQTILFNRIGKSRLDELTKAEAAQIISYLATPGAVW